MTKPHRALCANLTAALNDWQCETGDDRYAALIARAALAAQPEPPPTLKEQALEQLRSLQQCGAGHRDTDKIRQALEAL